MTKKNSMVFAALLAAITVSLFAPLNAMVTARGHKTPSSVAGNPVVDGAALFGSKCALCHGKDGVGLANWKSKGQPDFTNPEWQKARTDEQIADSIKNGKGKYMPGFKGKFSDEETGAVVQQIRAFGKKK
jgi:mono/diheme cytochrome c family protein